jgi:hypothetical protein
LPDKYAVINAWFATGRGLMVLEVESIDFLRAPVKREQGRIIGKETDPIVPKTAYGHTPQIEYALNSAVWNTDANQFRWFLLVLEVHEIDRLSCDQATVPNALASSVHLCV